MELVVRVKHQYLTYSLPEIKQLPFRSHFQAKMNLIMAEYLTILRAGRKMKVDVATLRKWLNDGQRLPSQDRHLAKIDEHYFLCWERRELRQGRKAREKHNYEARRKAARITADQEWQKEAGRQAIDGTANFISPSTTPVGSPFNDLKKNV